MKITESFEHYIRSLPKRGAERASARRRVTLAGNLTDLRSQLFFSTDRTKVMEDMWRETDLSDVNPTLLDFERSEREKLGPWSYMRPWDERRDDVLAFDSRKGMSGVDERAYNEALEYVRRLIPQSSIKPLSLESAWDALPHTTSKGLPYLTRDNSVIDTYLERARQGITDDKPVIYPFFLGWRGQAHGIRLEDVSQRLIWEADKTEALISARWLYPILGQLRKRKEFAAWNDLDVVNSTMQECFKVASGQTIYSTDFSGFDASLAERLLNDLFDVIIHWANVGDNSQGLNGVRENIISGSILSPDGILGRKPGGLPSGVEFTSLLGTLANLFSALYVGRALKVAHRFGTYLGDDAVNVYHPDPGAGELGDAAGSLGLDQNAEKQFVSKEAIHYLQNLYLPDGSGGMRPLSRAINGMLSYERRRNPKTWNHALASIRTIEQAENCKFHPKFEQFVKFIAKGDGWLTRYPTRVLMKMAGGVKLVEETLGRAQFRYTSWSLEDVQTFETSKVLERQ